MLGTSGVGAASGTFDTWLGGGDIQIYGTWSDVSSAAQTQVWPITSGGDYVWLTGAGATRPKLEIAVGGIFVGEGDTWAGAASGALDSRWQQSANTIKAAWGSRTYADLYLNFAREMNGGTWNPWYVTPANAANFRAAWARWAAIQRATMPGVKLVITFNDGTGGGMATPLDLWPTTQRPDICGVDTYNAWPRVNDLTAWNAKINVTGSGGYPIGIEAWRLQAAAWGVPMALSEWANRSNDPGDGGGGGDSAYWVNQMLNWCYANAGTGPGKIAYAIWFNHGPAEGYSMDYRVFTGSGDNAAQPNASAAFRVNAHSL